MLNKADIKALSLGFLAAFFSGTHSVIARHLTEHIHGLTIAALRLYIASAAVFLILKGHQKTITIDWSGKTLLIAVLAFSANFAVFHWGLEYASASSAMVLENTSPVFVLLFTVLVLRAPTRIVEIAAVFVAIFGVYFTVRNDFALGANQVFGDELELLAGVTWAIFIVASSRGLLGTVNTFQRLCFLFAVLSMSAVILTPFLFIYTISLTMNDIILLVLLGIFPTAVAYYLWYETAARVSAVTTSLLFTLTVIFTFVNAYVFIDEPITFDMLVGAVLIIASVLISKFPAKDK